MLGAGGVEELGSDLVQGEQRPHQEGSKGTEIARPVLIVSCQVRPSRGAGGGDLEAVGTPDPRPVPTSQVTTGLMGCLPAQTFSPQSQIRVQWPH